MVLVPVAEEMKSEDTLQHTASLVSRRMNKQSSGMGRFLHRFVKQLRAEKLSCSAAATSTMLQP